MQFLTVDEYYDRFLRGKKEDEILKEIQRLKKNVSYWNEKWHETAEEQYKARQKEAKFKPIKRFINWYKYNVKNLALETDEIFEARTEWAFAGVYLERVEKTLADMRAKKAKIPTHQIVIVKAFDKLPKGGKK